MPIRIRARNFQSIEDAEIVVDRFTVVTGPNNSGKTALQRAVQGVFTNPSGDAFVRHGAEKLIVDIDFGNDETVSWEKGPKVKPKYTVKGKAIHPGRQVPDEVLTLGIQPIQAGAIAVWPQVAPQFTGQVFLLDLPGSAIAEAVADVERVGKLTQALRLAESDKRSASAELKVRKKDVETANSALSEFAGLDAVGVVVLSVEQTFEDARATRVQFEAAEKARTRIQNATAEANALAGVRLVQVPSEELASKALNTGRACTQIEGVRTRLTKAQLLVGSLQGLRDVRVPPAPTKAIEAQRELREAQTLRQKVSSSTAASKKIEAMRAALAQINEANLQQKIDRASQAKKGNTFLEGLRTRMSAAKGEIASLTSTLAEKKQLLDATEVEIREVLGGMGSCPVCQTSISGSHTH